MGKERGQSLVELAVSFVFIMFLLAGAVEFGIAFFQFVQLRDAAQEGALYGSICPDHTQEIENRTRNSSTSPLDLTSSDIQVDISLTRNGTVVAHGQPEDAVEVSVVYAHKMFMPFFVGREIVLRGIVVDTVLTEDKCP
jgi:Flp pilus assembly protein TadG